MQGYAFKADEQDGSVVLIPSPASVKPKVGHWRTSPRAKVKMATLKRNDSARDNPLLSGRVEGDYTAEASERKRTRRQREAELMLTLREQGYIE